MVCPSVMENMRLHICHGLFWTLALSELEGQRAGLSFDVVWCVLVSIANLPFVVYFGICGDTGENGSDSYSAESKFMSSLASFFPNRTLQVNYRAGIRN